MNEFVWKKAKNKDKQRLEKILRNLEEDCVSACDRYLNLIPSRDKIWILFNKNKEIAALFISSRSTLIPVLTITPDGLKEMPPMKFLKGLIRRKRLHSVQGLTKDVIVVEKELEKFGKRPIEINDYDLMSLDQAPISKSLKEKTNIVLRAPDFDDINALLPLRKGYEEEEVLPKGSTFNPDAGKIVLAKFIMKKRILAAVLNGRIVGKIVVNAESFARYQIGGVFVLPEFRGKGIATYMTREFVTALINEGRGVTLFVKKHNIPAKRLYDSIGFKCRADYRISYY